MFPFILAVVLGAVPQSGDPAAARIGLKAHADAAALQKLPRFDYQARSRWGVIDALRAENKVGLAELTMALDGEVSQKPGESMPWFEFEFSWDETRFITGVRPGETKLNFSHRFGTRTDGWSRGEANDHSSVNFTRRRNVGQYWWAGGDDMGAINESSYLRFTPQTWWWGKSNDRTNQALTHRPLDGATWTTLPFETFAGEPCDVVEVSDQLGRFQTLWVSRASGRVRGVLSFVSGPDVPNSLVRFSDYREVAPGIWIPFSEAHTFAHSSATKGKWKLIRTERQVTAAVTGIDLSVRYAALLPRPGDRVQDQRFAVAVNTKYDPDRPDADIQKEADAEYAKRLKDAELIKTATEPFARMVGKPAPPLPSSGWVGGSRPEVAGKPYLVHFWATWCGPCKNDFPRLKELAARGVIVVGAHPADTSPDEVAKAVTNEKAGYPTVVSANAGPESIAGYPVIIFPYSVAVDARGNVAAHGTLDQVLEAVGRSVLNPPKP